MALPRDLINLTDVGLDVLVAGLKNRFLPHHLRQEFREDRVRFLEAAVGQIDDYYGQDSPAFLLAQWCLEVHYLLRNRVAQEEALEECAICDLERMQALAEFLAAEDTADDIRTLRGQIPFSRPEETLLQSSSGGFDNLTSLLDTAAAALQSHLSQLAGEELGEVPGDIEGLARLLSNRDFLSRYLVDGSQDRLEQCLILTRMVGVISALNRRGVAASVQAVSADAQRVRQLVAAIGIAPLAPPHAAPDQAEPAVAEQPSLPETYAAGPPAPDEDADADKAPAEDETAADADAGANLILSLDVPERKPAPPPAPPREAPAPAPVNVTRPSALQSDARDESGEAEEEPVPTGSGRLLLALGVVVLVLGALVVVFSGDLAPGDSLNLIETLQRRLAGAPALVEEPTAEPAPTEPVLTVAATPAPTATFTPEPTATAVPEPTPTFTPAIPSDVAHALVPLYMREWPHLAAQRLGEEIGAGTPIVLVRRVMDPENPEDSWVQLLEGGYVEGRMLENVPEELPWVVIETLGMPDFDAAIEPPAALVQRIGPGPDFAEGPSLPRDAAIEPIGISPQGDWALLDTRYWVPVGLLQSLPDGLPVALAPYAVSLSNVRSQPSSASELVATRAEGETLVLTAQTQGTNPDGVWYRLADGGWIFGQLVADAPADLPVE